MASEGMFLSWLDIEVIQKFKDIIPSINYDPDENDKLWPEAMSKRERNECKEKLKKLGII